MRDTSHDHAPVGVAKSCVAEVFERILENPSLYPLVVAAVVVAIAGVVVEDAHADVGVPGSHTVTPSIPAAMSSGLLAHEADRALNFAAATAPCCRSFSSVLPEVGFLGCCRRVIWSKY